ncbi:efflux RND transporter periplasmic adaptor subunit [Cupriavidus pauculus]|uniref:Efflux RND transporter periplasmic adaptor subunit n=1 Tax=Cupriavidus pauculus TaxID=82633 RepID=A0A5P2HCE8_9BURK|nr:efflux RND transporter periplasmic adaptor subunit [Cupriavidus pauculus]QET05254.1 efflux RND transporter periplasmic adaptor subunit [Cupriavidus pauculus]
MNMTNKQTRTIIAILVVGVLATAAVLLIGRGGGEDGHDEDHAHEARAQAHDEEKPAAKPAEDTVRLTREQIQQAGITVAEARAGSVQGALSFPGEIRFNEDRTAHVVPRLAGVVEAVPADLGQMVRKGQVLAVIASTALSDQRSELLAAQRRLELARTTYTREKSLWEQKISAEQDYLAARNALQEAEIGVQNARQKLTAIGADTGSGGALNRFELRAPFDGMIVEKHLTLGEAVAADAAIFTISDLRSVWAEFVVAARDLGSVRVGERATIRSTASDSKAEGTVSYVGALLGEQTRTAKARVTLTNPDMAWRPGLFVTVNVLGAAQQVPVSVLPEAVQQVEGRTVVFVETPDGFRAQPVTVGRTSDSVSEIVSGLEPGRRYAAANSFVLKAELGKAGTEHSH